MMLPVRTTFTEKTTVRLERKLPGPGKILVRPGDKVGPDDPVGTAEISGGFRKINLTELLGVGPHQAEKSLLKGPGEAVYKGEPLARAKSMLGLRRKVYLSPVDGVVEGITGGEVTVRFAPSEIELPSGFDGVVESVSEGEAAIIRTAVSRFRGVVGFGKERFGNIKLVGKAGEFLLPQHLDSSAGGKIVVGGAIATADTIEKALAIGVKGLVTGGINFHETLGWSEGSDIGITIVALEGYGFHGIDEDLYGKLGKIDGQYGAISGDPAEILISIEGEAEEISEPAWRELKVGDIVRVVAGEELGSTGSALEVSREPLKLPSGLSSSVVTFQSGGKKLAVPWQNLEIVGEKR